MADGMEFNGYAYELLDTARGWDKAADGCWSIAMVSGHDSRAIRELGSRRIDDAPCMVFLCADGRARAITMNAKGAQP